MLNTVILSSLVGILSGVSSTLLLNLLDFATQTRTTHSNLILWLPLGGLLTGFLYHSLGPSLEKGPQLILEEIHDLKNRIPLRMGPLVLLGTFITHLFGGSAGREGTAVQLGATLGHEVSKIFNLNKTSRKELIIAGISAGFSSAMGVPLAGTLFGIEIVSSNKLKPFSFSLVIKCFIASMVGYGITLLLKAPHSRYPLIQPPTFHIQDWGALALSGIVFGFSAFLFLNLTHTIERIYKYFSIPRFLRPFTGGIILVIIYKILGSYRYAGLGLSTIQEALKTQSSLLDPFLKWILSCLTIASGFKGGEFVPLVFIGSTLGSALSSLFSLPCSLLGALGFTAIFAGASNAPLTCSLLAIELFGISIAPYAFFICFMSYYFSGQQSIYQIQK